MKMSEGVEWAIHCSALLALLPPNRTLSGKALAEYHGVSESYLLKHLKSMVASGLLDSTLGPKGGFRLAKPAHEITYLHVVQAIDGLDPAFRCTEIRQRGPVSAKPEHCVSPCAVNASMLRAELAWRSALQSESIGKLVSHLGEVVPAESVSKRDTWLSTNMR